MFYAVWCRNLQRSHLTATKRRFNRLIGITHVHLLQDVETRKDNTKVAKKEDKEENARHLLASAIVSLHVAYSQP
jgi:hypothetical protein